MQGSFLSSFIEFGQIVLEEKWLLQINKSAILLLMLSLVILDALLHLCKLCFMF